MSNSSIEAGRISPQPSVEEEVIFDDQGKQIAEVKTYMEPQELTPFQWTHELDNHVQGTPDSILLIAEDGRLTHVTRTAMEEISGFNPQIRAEYLFPLARKASGSTLVILTSNTISS